MRLKTLELIAFGPFTEKSLDFSNSETGLHLVWGQNEAGKSSALRALTCLLYGIPPKTPDNFIHDHKALRIGATISHSDKSELTVIRRKGLKNTLLSPSGDALPDSILDKYLGGVTREMFSAMFGIDQAELVEGGRAIVEGRGQLGESLFAAGMGIAGMRDIMGTLAAEAGDLFKPNAKNPKINRLLNEHKTLKKQILESTLSAREWSEHDRQLKAAKEEKERLAEDLRIHTAERNRLARLSKAIPKIVRLKKCQSEIEKLGQTVLLSPEFSNQRKQVQVALGQALSLCATLEKELTEIQNEQKKISSDTALIHAQAEISGLFQRAGSHKKAMQDLPRRRADLYRLNEEAQAILKHLGDFSFIEEAESLRLTDPQIAKIRKLGRETEPLSEREKTIRKTLSGLAIDLKTAAHDLAKIPMGKNTGDLEQKLDEIKRQGDLSAFLETRSRALKAIQAQADLALARLGLWQGTLDDLERLPVPEPVTLECFESDTAGLKLRQAQLTLDIKVLMDRIAELAQQQDVLNTAGDIPGIQDLEEARSRRNKGWQLVMDAWRHGKTDEAKIRSFDPDATHLAEAYQKSVEEADHIADRLRHESDRIAAMESLQRDQAGCVAQKQALEKEKVLADEESRHLWEKWLALWQPLHIQPLSPKEMSGWHQNYKNLILQAQEQRGLAAECGHLKTAIQDHLAGLKTCLEDLGAPYPAPCDDLEHLLSHSDAIVEKNRGAVRQRAALDSQIGDIKRRMQTAEEDLQQVLKDRDAWASAWGAAISVLGLDSTSLPDEVDAVLTRTQQLFERLDQAMAMKGRILAIEADAEEFSAAVRKTSRRLAPDISDSAPEEIATCLNDRLTLSLENKARLEALEKQEKGKSASIREERIKIDEMGVQLREMCRQAEVDTPDALPEVEKKSAYVLDLKDHIRQIEKELAEISGGADLADFTEAASRVNPDELPSAIKELDMKIQAFEEMRSAVDQTIGREKAAIKAMDGSGAASDLAEKSQAVLADMRGAAERFALLQAALWVLQKEIEQYREANQGPVLKRAGEIFSAMTRNSFSGLTSDYDEKDNPILMGIRPSKGKVPVSGMSDGTCDQLYLSLRLASLEQRLSTSEPMPLVMDDILINFDDERSAAALDTLAALSRSTQVIFFTHHRHLVDLAEAHVDKTLLFKHRLEMT